MLEVSGLRAGYGTVEILRDVTLNVADGDIVALLGSNGVGKTTFASVLSGIVPQWGGTIIFNGKTLPSMSAQRMVDYGLIHVPEGRHVFPNLSVYENLMLGAYRRGKPNRRQNMEKVFATFPRLAERRRQKAGTLSGGEQQMLAIGRGLMSEPVLLVLDEPSIGLSPLLVEEMFGLIQQLNNDGLGILLVEQNVLQSLEIANQAFVMENGVISLSGDAANLINDPALQQSYLGMGMAS